MAHGQSGIPAPPPIPVETLMPKKRATFSGVSWMRNAARSALMSKFRRPSLKSPHRGDSAIASIPVHPCSIDQTIRRAIAGSIVVTDDMTI
jgi:hypothetical protein